jgi:hydrogenase maturation protease
VSACPDPALRRTGRTLVIGCGNILRGDDAVGPVLIRELLDRTLPDDVICADGGTGGMDVAFTMRGMNRVILIDACTTGEAPGTIYKVPGAELEDLPPLTGINLHSFKWDHALAFARWLLKDEYPRDISVYLIEAGSLELGAPLSPAVQAAKHTLIEHLLIQLWCADGPRGHAHGAGLPARAV